MKKVMKLAWMVLFALPMISLTSCSDDENGDLGKDEVALFKDYSVLIDKDAEGVVKYMGEDPVEIDPTDGTQTFEVMKDNVDLVQAIYSDEDGIIYKKVMMVDSYLSDLLKPDAVTNYLNRIYHFDGVDEDGWYWYSYKDLTIFYIPQSAVEDDEVANDVMYVNNKKMDGSRATASDIKAFVKAHRLKK